MAWENKTEDKESKFNAGLAQLERINEIKKAMHTARLFQNNQAIVTCLTSWHLELCEFMGPDDKRKSILYQKKLSSLVNNKIVNSQIVINNCIEYHEFLQMIEKRAGLSMPYKETAFDAVMS